MTLDTRKRQQADPAPFHRSTYIEPPAPKPDLICPGCRRSVPYLIWRDAWRCTGCTDPTPERAA